MDLSGLHALQGTAPCVAAPASAALPTTLQVPRRNPRRWSLGHRALPLVCK